MKLKNSEKKLLGILGLAILSYIIFNYGFFPLFDQNTLIKAEYEAVDTEYQALLKTHLTNNQLAELLNSANSKFINLETLLPPQIHQEESILFLTNLAKKHEMSVDSYNFSYTDTAQIPTTGDGKVIVPNAPVDDVLKEFQKLINGDQNADIGQFKDKIYQAPKEETGVLAQYEKDLTYFNVVISLGGNYTKFKNYLLDLESYKSKIIIKQINLAKSTESRDGVLGTLTISYPIYYDQEHLSPFVWSYEKGANNLNPFEYEVFKLESVPVLAVIDTTDTETSVSQPIIQAPIEKPKSDYSAADFYMVLEPANSDSNTLTIGKSPYRYTALYADNDGVENATLKVRKSDGKYQYQYSTSLQTYPGEGDWNDFDLMNKNGLVLEVQSLGRLPQNDQAGTLISISNDSGLPLTVYIYKDDSARPRLTINKVSGKITIKKL